MSRERPSREELLSLFSYNPATGIIRRVKATSHGAVARIPGTILKAGHRRIRIDGKRYLATHLIWVMMTGRWPDRDIDHKDPNGPKADWGDRWENLRLATHAQNMQNRRVNAGHRTGLKGASKTRNGTYRAVITVDGKPISLGHFKSKIEAALAYDTAAKQFFGEFACLNFPDGFRAVHVDDTDMEPFRERGIHFQDRELSIREEGTDGLHG